MMMKQREFLVSIHGALAEGRVDAAIEIAQTLGCTESTKRWNDCKSKPRVFLVTLTSRMGLPADPVLRIVACALHAKKWAWQRDDKEPGLIRWLDLATGEQYIHPEASKAS